MDRLIEATMAYGLVPPVVMEFPGITAGGGFSGTSGESSSFRHGFFNETINWVEMVLGNGEIVKASREERADLFHGAAGAAGTLGITTLMEVRLVEAKKFVKTTYRRFNNTADAISDIKSETENPDVDYVDDIVYSQDHGVVVTGQLTNVKPAELTAKTFSHASDPWFYLHAQDKTQHLPLSSTFIEYIPLADYLFRYDRAGFWVGRQGYTYFKVVPFNKFFRWLLDYSHSDAIPRPSCKSHLFAVCCPGRCPAFRHSQDLHQLDRQRTRHLATMVVSAQGMLHAHLPPRHQQGQGARARERRRKTRVRYLGRVSANAQHRSLGMGTQRL